MRKLILIGGDLAGGKSTFARQLGEQFHIMVLHKDNLKELLGDQIHVRNREENKKLSVISFEFMKYVLMQNYGTLVLESNFKPEEMEELKKLVQDYEYEVMSLKFVGNNILLHQRFLKRLNENRHYVHKSQDFSRLEDFVQTLEELRSVSYIGEEILVDCSDFSYFNDASLMKKVENFIKKCKK